MGHPKILTNLIEYFFIFIPIFMNFQSIFRCIYCELLLDIIISVTNIFHLVNAIKALFKILFIVSCRKLKTTCGNIEEGNFFHIKFVVILNIFQKFSFLL